MTSRELEIALLDADLAAQRAAGVRTSPEFDALIGQLQATSAALDNVISLGARRRADAARARTEAAHWAARRLNGDDCA